MKNILTEYQLWYSQSFTQKHIDRCPLMGFPILFSKDTLILKSNDNTLPQEKQGCNTTYHENILTKFQIWGSPKNILIHHYLLYTILEIKQQHSLTQEKQWD